MDNATIGYIYRVTFPSPPFAGNESTDYYFYSLAAIYERFTPEQIGCKVERLWAVGVSDGKVYTNSKVTISRQEIIRKKQRHRNGVTA